MITDKTHEKSWKKKKNQLERKEEEEKMSKRSDKQQVKRRESRRQEANQNKQTNLDNSPSWQNGTTESHTQIGRQIVTHYYWICVCRGRRHFVLVVASLLAFSLAVERAVPTEERRRGLQRAKARKKERNTQKKIQNRMD
jgi:hypothetical protein